MPLRKLSSGALGFRVTAALILLAGGGLLILEAVVIVANGSVLAGSPLGLLGFVMLIASIWLLRSTYEKLH